MAGGSRIRVCPRVSGSSWNGCARRTPLCGWSGISQKKVAAWFAKEQPREYAVIANWVGEKEFPVTFMCAQLGVVRQGYCRWLAMGNPSGSAPMPS